MKKISYYLSENPLTTSEENPYMARVKTKDTLNQDDLIRAMLKKNTTVTRQDIIVVLDLLRESVKEQILDGFNLVTDLFKTRVSIKGGFQSTADEFDKNRHRVCVNLTASSDFQSDLAYSAQVEATDPNAQSPIVRQIWDYRTKAFATEFTGGQLVMIRGAHFMEDEVETGVYLQPEGTEERITVPLLHNVTGRSLLCNFPEGLAAGRYWVYVIRGEGDKAPRGWYKTLIDIS